MTQLTPTSRPKSMFGSRVLMLMAVAVVFFVGLAGTARAQQWTTPDAANNINNTNTGNVGVGTTTPALPLEVRGNALVINDGRAVIGAYDTRAVAQGVGGGIQFGGKYNSSIIAGFASISGIKENATSDDFSSALVFTTRVMPNIQTEKMRISSSGRVGIGTTAPGYLLDVQSNAQWVARFKKTDATNGGVIIDAASGYNPNLAMAVNGTIKWYMNSNSANNDTLQFWESTGNSPRFTLSQSGNVGIGVAAPAGRIDVRQVGNGGTFATLLTSYGANEDTYLRGGSSSAVLHIGDLSSTTAKVLIAEAGGNVGIGTTSPSAKLHVQGNGLVTGNLTVDGNIAAKYQDVAEWVESSQALPAGTVVVLDHTKFNQVVASSQSYDTRVAGVISLQPGITLGENGAGKVLVATTGRVRIKVDASRGSIQVGDLLVTSDLAGVAMRSLPIDVGGVPIHRPGTLIGKALEPLAKGSGEILVLLSLQ